MSYSAVLGGAERVLIESSAALEGEVCLACPPGALAAAGVAAGIRTFSIRPLRLQVRERIGDRILAVPRLLSHSREIRRLVRDLDPALVVACGMRPALGAAGAGRITPPVVFEHHDFIPGPMIGRAVAAAARRAAIVVTPSHAVARELTALDRRLEPRVVHPGIDVARFASRRAPADPPEILFLGALVGWKHPEFALEVCALVRARRPDVRLRFVGASLPGDDGALAQRLQRRVSELHLADAVEFVGAVADPRPELERASLLLHCTPREPFGLAIVEALATGRPAVVPAAGGPAEIVADDCGILYPAGDVAAAARGVLTLLEDPARAQALGENGRRRAMARFDKAEARRRFAAAVGPVARASQRARPQAPLALVTVTRNSAADLEALLASVQRHLPDVPVIVVDSASEDATLSVAQGCGQAAAISLTENVGFGRACNIGLAVVQAPVAALINPDVELVDDSLRTLAAEALRGEEGPRLLAPLVLNSDGSRQDSAHPRPGSLPDALRIVLPPRRFPGRIGLALAPWRADAPRQVGWAVGCALVARTDVLRLLGPFDERIFLFGEDLDLCLHAAQRGVETWFWPAARVIHHGGRSTASEFGGEPFDLLAQARRRVIRRRLGPSVARRDDVMQALTFTTRIAAKRVLGRSAARERRQLRALSAAQREPT